MAQDFDQILNLLREMQFSNNNNNQSFERLLNTISSKIDSTNQNMSVDLLKTYVNELSKSVESKYSITLEKFSNIEQALRAMYSAQTNLSSQNDIKSMFDAFSSGLNALYNDFKQEKALITSLESRISEFVNNKSDKEEIVRTISLLRNDFENINNTYRNIVDDINTNLKSIISTVVRLDPLKTNEEVKNQIDVTFHSISDIITRLGQIEERNYNLEKLIENVSTSEELKTTSGIIDTILIKIQNIETAIEKLAPKSEIENITEFIKEKSATKEHMTKLKKRADSIISTTDELKNLLAETIQNIENIPKINELERILTNLYAQIEVIFKNINNDHTKDAYLEDFSDRLSQLKDEIVTSGNIISDISETVNNKVIAGLENLSNENSNLKDIISEQMAQFPTKSEIEEILSKNNTLLDNLFMQTQSIAQTIKNNVTKDDIKNSSDNLISIIESKTKSLEKWLEDSNVKDNSQKAIELIQTKAEQKDIIAVYNYTEQIVNILQELTKSTNLEEINSVIKNISNKIDDFKTEYLKNNTNEKSELLEKLDTFKSELSKIVTEKDFSIFIADIKDYIDQAINQIPSNDAMQKVGKNILDRIENIDFSNVVEILSTRFSNLNKSINEQLTDIRDLILSNSLQNIPKDVTDNDSIQEYIKEIKNIINSRPDFQMNDEINDRLLNIELALGDNKTSNKKINEILEKIDNIEFTNNHNDIEASKKELQDIKKGIESLNETLKNNSSSSEIIDFISQNLEQLASQTEKNSKEVLEQSFSYNTQLLEEKTALLLDFIKEAKSEKNNTEISNKLEIADNKLTGYKEELELINTDIRSLLDLQTQELISELAPVKELAKDLNNEDVISDIKNQIDELQALIEQENDTEIYENLDILYDKVSKDLTDCQNNLKDFVLSETDSVLIKLDNLREYVETTLDEFVPPEVKSNNELFKFATDIEKFKKAQIELFDNAVETLKNDIQIKHNEIVSILNNTNNNDVLEAIKELKSRYDAKIADNKDQAKSLEKYDQALTEIKNLLQTNNIEKLLKEVNAKVDVIASGEEYELIENLSDSIEIEIGQKIQEINEKLDNIAKNNSDQRANDFAKTDFKLTSMLEDLTQKIDNLSSQTTTGDFEEVKELINQQKQYIETLEPSSKNETLSICLDELSDKVSKLSSQSLNSTEFNSVVHNMKESIMNAVVAIFDQVSFVEESEDIKDFVEERTDEINQNISHITKQLQQISSISDYGDYTYSMQDIETDLAKLRLALKDIQDNKTEIQTEELSNITDKLRQITSSVDSLTQDEIKGLKSEISTLKEQTQFLVATSDKSITALNSGDFDSILKGNLTNKVDNVVHMLENCTNNDTVIRQSLIYMGEWIDSATENINKIVENSDNMQNRLDKIESQMVKFEDLEEKLEEQTERINRLEMNLEKILSAIENLDDDTVSQKMEKIEKQMSKLNNNVEKLASYVE